MVFEHCYYIISYALVCKIIIRLLEEQHSYFLSSHSKTSSLSIILFSASQGQVFNANMSSPQPANLLTIPGKLRHQIYNDLMEQSHKISIFTAEPSWIIEWKDKPHNVTDGYLHSLFLSCTQLQDEITAWGSALTNYYFLPSFGFIYSEKTKFYIKADDAFMGLLDDN